MKDRQMGRQMDGRIDRDNPFYLTCLYGFLVRPFGIYLEFVAVIIIGKPTHRAVCIKIISSWLVSFLKVVVVVHVVVVVVVLEVENQ